MRGQRYNTSHTFHLYQGKSNIVLSVGLEELIARSWALLMPVTYYFGR